MQNSRVFEARSGGLPSQGSYFPAGERPLLTAPCLPGTADLGAELNAAMKGIADANPDLAGALPQGYSGLPNDVLQ